LGELVKRLWHRGAEPQIYFWRTSTGAEVDFIVQTNGNLVPIEVKLTATPRPAMAATVRSFRESVGERAAPGYVVHPGGQRLPMGHEITALPFDHL
ncbi:MAG TPA: DUF4143 domain-containing protein, partial [Phycisphaerae bacterium]|nr:DUF4143 domain-containing protein [Phycisphaerae bacterium]